MSWAYTDAFGVPIAGALALGDVEAGIEETPTELVAWYRRGETDGTPIADVAFEDAVYDAGRWVRAGHPAMDQHYHEARVVGLAAGSPAAQPSVRTGWTVLGAYRRLDVGEVHPGAGLRLEIRRRVPSTAAADTVRWRLQPRADVHAWPTPPCATPGILPGVGDRTAAGVLRGGAITAYDPADATIHVDARLVLTYGRTHGRDPVDVVLDDLDASLDPLTVGTAYRMVISQGPDELPTVTKSDGAAEPVAPPLPAGHAELGRWRVDHSGGPPVIDAADEEAGPVGTRFAVSAGTGLDVIVQPGQAQGPDWRARRSRAESVPVPAESSWWLWILPTGRFDVTTTAEPVEPSAEPLAEGTTDTDGVTSVVDRRRWAVPPAAITLDGSVAAADDSTPDLVVPHDMDLFGASIHWLDAAGATSGTVEAQLDVLLGGVGDWAVDAAGALYLPWQEALPYDAAPPVADAWPVLGRLQAGDRVRARLVTAPAGLTSARLVVTLRGWTS